MNPEVVKELDDAVIELPIIIDGPLPVLLDTVWGANVYAFELMDGISIILLDLMVWLPTADIVIYETLGVVTVECPFILIVGPFKDMAGAT
jgi:hypothetical protein